MLVYLIVELFQNMKLKKKHFIEYKKISPAIEEIQSENIFEVELKKNTRQRNMNFEISELKKAISALRVKNSLNNYTSRKEGRNSPQKVSALGLSSIIGKINKKEPKLSLFSQSKGIGQMTFKRLTKEVNKEDIGLSNFTAIEKNTLFFNKAIIPGSQEWTESKEIESKYQIEDLRNNKPKKESKNQRIRAFKNSGLSKHAYQKKACKVNVDVIRGSIKKDTKNDCGDLIDNMKRRNNSPE